MSADLLVRRYLERLSNVARALPRKERGELLGEIRSHIEASLQHGASQHEVEALLAELGNPSEIVSAALPAQRLPRRGSNELWAVLLMVIPIAPPFSWIFGAVLLCRSKLWSARQKLLALLLWPGGYTGVLLAVALMGGFHANTCSTSAQIASNGHVLYGRTCSTRGVRLAAFPGGLGSGVAVLALYILIPILVATYLYRVAGKEER